MLNVICSIQSITIVLISELLHINHIWHYYAEIEDLNCWVQSSYLNSHSLMRSREPDLHQHTSLSTLVLEFCGHITWTGPTAWHLVHFLLYAGQFYFLCFLPHLRTFFEFKLYLNHYCQFEDFTTLFLPFPILQAMNSSSPNFSQFLCCSVAVSIMSSPLVLNPESSLFLWTVTEHQRLFLLPPLPSNSHFGAQIPKSRLIASWIAFITAFLGDKNLLGNRRRLLVFCYGY